MAIGVLPHELRLTKNLASLPVTKIDWPGQAVPLVNVLGDLGKHDHVVVYPSSRAFLRPFKGLKCQVSLLLAEPKAVHGKYYKLLFFLRFKFKFVLCRYGGYAKKYKNVLAIPIVESWVAEKETKAGFDKQLNCSLISSSKMDLDGHKLRHELVRWIYENDIPVSVIGRGYVPFEKKSDGLGPYRFSVVIENTQEKDYFTEKLLDCILCDTLPIYWGSSNIDDYFDLDGMIICNSLEALKNKLRCLPNSIQTSQIEAMKKNKAIALKLAQLNQRVVSLIKSSAAQ